MVSGARIYNNLAWGEYVVEKGVKVNTVLR